MADEDLLIAVLNGRDLEVSDVYYRQELATWMAFRLRYGPGIIYCAVRSTYLSTAILVDNLFYTNRYERIIVINGAHGIFRHDNNNMLQNITYLNGRIHRPAQDYEILHPYLNIQQYANVLHLNIVNYSEEQFIQLLRNFSHYRIVLGVCNAHRMPSVQNVILNIE